MSDLAAIASLGQQAIDNITHAVKYGLKSEDAGVTLTVPRGWKAPPGFPRIETLQIRPTIRVGRVNAVRFLKWLVDNNLVKLEIQKP